VQQWHGAAQRDPQELRAVGFGVRSPSGVERAVGMRTANPDWHRRLTAALPDFPGTDWVPAQLVVPATEAGS
jgi:hypothetical protein